MATAPINAMLLAPPAGQEKYRPMTGAHFSVHSALLFLWHRLCVPLENKHGSEKKRSTGRSWGPFRRVILVLLRSAIITTYCYPNILLPDCYLEQKRAHGV